MKRIGPSSFSRGNVTNGIGANMVFVHDIRMESPLHVAEGAIVQFRGRAELGCYGNALCENLVGQWIVAGRHNDTSGFRRHLRVIGLPNPDMGKNPFMRRDCSGHGTCAHGQCFPLAL